MQDTDMRKPWWVVQIKIKECLQKTKTAVLLYKSKQKIKKEAHFNIA